VTVTASSIRVLLVALALGLSGCSWPGQPKESERPVPPDKVVNFNKLYDLNCAGCHGAEGKLGPAPPLNDPLYLTLVTDKELAEVIREGRRVNAKQKTPMPAFAQARGGPLTEAQVKVLAEGIRKRWPQPARPAGETPPGLHTEQAGPGNIEAGGKVFRQACAGCHGTDGKGGDKAGAINDPERAFLALISDQALRRIAITGRPDLGMPDYAGKDGRKDFQPLTGKDIDDLVALLASWRRTGPANGK
jgi:mono/diheme cytochrome c family protein